MSRDSLQAVRAVFLAAIMVISVFAAGIAFSGSAAAFITDIEEVSTENVTANDPSTVGSITINGVETDGGDGTIFINTGNNADISIENANVTDTGNFSSSNVSISAISGSSIEVQIAGDDSVSGDITLDVTLNTLNTSNTNPGDTAVYNVSTNGGEVGQISSTFVLEASPTVRLLSLTHSDHGRRDSRVHS